MQSLAIAQGNFELFGGVKNKTDKLWCSTAEIGTINTFTGFRNFSWTMRHEYSNQARVDCEVSIKRLGHAAGPFVLQAPRFVVSIAAWNISVPADVEWVHWKTRVVGANVEPEYKLIFRPNIRSDAHEIEHPIATWNETPNGEVWVNTSVFYHLGEEENASSLYFYRPIDYLLQLWALTPDTSGIRSREWMFECPSHTSLKMARFIMSHPVKDDIKQFDLTNSTCDQGGGSEQ